MKTTTAIFLFYLLKSLKVICEVLLSIIPEELLYQEAINKEALFCFYTNIYIDKTVKEGAAACYGSLNNIKNLINKKEIKHNVINIYLHMVTELLLGATNTTTAATQNGLDI